MADKQLPDLTAATAMNGADLFLTRQDATTEDRKVSGTVMKTFMQDGLFVKASDSTDDISEGASNLFYTGERVDDRVAALLTAGTNMTLNYDDGAGTLTIDGPAIPAVPVDSVFGRTGDVVAASGDYDAEQVSYDNTASGLSASDVQAAVDELQAAHSDFFAPASQTTDDISEGASNLFYTGERVDDRVAALLTAGTNMTLSYDDGAGTLTIDGPDIPSVPVDSVFGRTGDVVAASGDYDAGQVSYDNTASGMSASDVQAAVDELAAGKADKLIAINAQSGTSYTLVAGDAGGYVRFDNASPIALTVPPNSAVAYAVGTMISVRQAGVGQLSLIEGSGVTINTPQTLKLSGQGAAATLIKVSTNTWDLVGDLEALS